jgi:hypothetical protein
MAFKLTQLRPLKVEVEVVAAQSLMMSSLRNVTSSIYSANKQEIILRGRATREIGYLWP